MDVSTRVTQDLPCAAPGLESFRYPRRNGGYVMIGAVDYADALRKAERSIGGKAEVSKLQIWVPHPGGLAGVGWYVWVRDQINSACAAYREAAAQVQHNEGGDDIYFNFSCLAINKVTDLRHYHYARNPYVRAYLSLYTAPRPDLHDDFTRWHTRSEALLTEIEKTPPEMRRKLRVMLLVGAAEYYEGGGL